MSRVDLSSNSDSELSWIPEIGKEFDSVEEAFEFWNTYGRRVGFSCRYQYCNISKRDQKCTSARFVCNKEGLRKPDKRDQFTKNPRAETRTNCLARIDVRRDRNTMKYTIKELELDHNHELHLPITAHLMPSQRKITKLDAHEIDLADASGIRPRESNEFRGRLVGGVANLGYTQVDQRNYLRTKRQRELQYGEAGCVITYFQQKAQENPSFYFDMQLDNEEQVTNIFWADARMLIDYAFFGDVVTFDTTFGTNKENRPLGVLAGFNHHKKIVIFGATLLYDETAPSFEWVFKTFLKAHKQKMPQTIFTDQDAAMGKAIKEVMPDVYHGLCTYHIMENAVRKLGGLLKNKDDLLEDISACMYKYEDEEKFEDAWGEMLHKHELQDNSWMNGLYKLKEKWALCYMKMTYNIGMRSTQLSESFNKDLKYYLKYNLDINRFFKQFERVVDAKRNKDLEYEYSCREKQPRIRLKNSPFVLQVCRVYTPYIFEEFQDEVDKASGIYIKHRDENDSQKRFVVGSVLKDEEYVVTFAPFEDIISCSCRKYETFGILCRHALRVLDICDIKKISDHYILQRWTRQAKNGVVHDNQGRNLQEDANLVASERYRTICPRFVQLALRCSENHRAWCHVQKNLEKLLKEVDVICENDVIVTESSPKTNSPDSVELQAGLEYNGHLVKGLKKKSGRKGGKRLKSWNDNPSFKKNVKGKGKQSKAVPGNMACNLSDSFILNNGCEVPNEVAWMSYQYDDHDESLPQVGTNQTSFTELLTGNPTNTQFPPFSQASSETHVHSEIDQTIGIQTFQTYTHL